jgi:hypothetical protein
MKKYFQMKAEAAVADYVKTHHSYIKVEPGDCRYNFYCHANAVHVAAMDSRKRYRVAMCVYFEEGSAVVHFVNEVQATGAYVDNTLGYWASFNDYYFIRWIGPDEYRDVFNIHKKYAKYLRALIPWYIRWFTDIRF